MPAGLPVRVGLKGWMGWQLRLETACACLFPRRLVPSRASTGQNARLGAQDRRRYFRVMTERRAYPSDLSDACWALIEPVLTAWRAERRRHALDIGRPPEHELREIMNAILYVDRTGVQWRYLPHDFPPWETVYGYFAK